MTEDDFVQNIGSALHSYQKAELKLYFSNIEGNALAEQTVKRALQQQYIFGKADRGTAAERP